MAAAFTMAGDEPIACTLQPSELAARREALLPGLVAGASRRDDIADGYRFHFAAAPGVLSEIAAVIEAERDCCRFFRFQLSVESSRDFLLEISGPPGTRTFLDGLIAS